jgi:hypothetical protein
MMMESVPLFNDLPRVPFDSLPSSARYMYIVTMSKQCSNARVLALGLAYTLVLVIYRLYRVIATCG